MEPATRAVQRRLVCVKTFAKRLRIITLLKCKNVWAAELIAEMLPESHLRVWSKRTWETHAQKVRELLRNVKELVVGWPVVCHMALPNLSVHKNSEENRWQSNLFKLIRKIINWSKFHMIDWLLLCNHCILLNAVRKKGHCHCHTVLLQMNEQTENFLDWNLTLLKPLIRLSIHWLPSGQGLDFRFKPWDLCCTANCRPLVLVLQFYSSLEKSMTNWSRFKSMVPFTVFDDDCELFFAGTCRYLTNSQISIWCLHRAIVGILTIPA